MTDRQKDIILLLLQPGHYMVKIEKQKSLQVDLFGEPVNNNSPGKGIYKIYHGRVNPVQYFRHSTVEKI